MHVSLRTIGGRFGQARPGIGASCYSLRIAAKRKKHHYLIDRGMDFSLQGALSSWAHPIESAALEEYGKIDGCFATHPHRDHINDFPSILDLLADDARIICSRPTAAFFPYMLNEQRTFSRRRGEEEPYSEENVSALLGRVMQVDEPSILELVPGMIWVLLWPSGHVRGSYSLIFLIKEGRKQVKIMFSGDYAVHDQFATLGAPLPPDAWMPDIIASFDCTFGDQDIPAWDDEMNRLMQDSQDTIRQGEKVLVFASAFDYCPSIAQKLTAMGITTLFDGHSVIKLAEIISSKEGSWCVQDQPIVLNGVQVCDYPGEGLDYPHPCAIVTSSGTGHGLAARYLSKMVSREHALIAAPGLVIPGSNGYRIMHAERGGVVSLEVDGKTVEVEALARRERYRLVAHSRQQDAIPRIHWLLEKSRFRKDTAIPLIGLHHGSSRALTAYEQGLPEYTSFRSDSADGRNIVLFEG